MSNTDHFKDILNRIAELKSALENPDLSALQPFLNTKLQTLLEEIRHLPDLQADDRQLKMHVGSGQAFGSVTGGTFEINNYFNQLPAEDRKCLTTWITQWIRNELNYLGAVDTVDEIQKLAAILMDILLPKGYAVQEFQNLTNILRTFDPNELSAFYEALDDTFQLSYIRWIDVAHLQHRLQDVDLSPDLIGIAYRIAHPKSIPPKEMKVQIYKLAQYPCIDELYHPLCTFVSILVEGIPEQHGQQILQEWLNQMKHERGMYPRLETQTIHSFQEAYVVIAIKEIHQDRYTTIPISCNLPALPENTPLFKEVLETSLQRCFYLDVWICDENGKLLYSQPSDIDEYYQVDQLLAQIRHKVQHAFQSIVNLNYQEKPPAVIIEFELEHDWLLCEVEHLSLEEVTPTDLADDIIPIPVGYDYPVTVRMHRQPTHLSQLEQKYSTWKQKNYRLEDCDITPLDEPAHSHKTYLMQQCKDSYAVLMTFVSDDQRIYRRIWHYASRNGIPLALCPRPGITHSGEAYAEVLRQILQTEHIGDIRTQVQQHRQQALFQPNDVGHHLILLWNDPKRHPNPREETPLISWKSRP